MARQPETPTISDAEAERRLKRGGRRFSLFGCFGFLLTLTALVIALLAWFEISPPEPAREKVRALQQRVTQKIESSELAERLSPEELIQSYHQARDYLAEPEKREQALEKLDQAKKSIQEWSEQATPKVKGAYQTLTEKTESAMESIRSGAQTARGEVEDLIKQAGELKAGIAGADSKEETTEKTAEEPTLPE